MRLFISPLYEAMKTINEKGDYMKFDQEFSIGVSGQVRGGGMLKRFSAHYNSYICEQRYI